MSANWKPDGQKAAQSHRSTSWTSHLEADVGKFRWSVDDNRRSARRPPVSMEFSAGRQHRRQASRSPANVIVRPQGRLLSHARPATLPAPALEWRLRIRDLWRRIGNDFVRKENMSNERPSPIAPICLVVGALLGFGGSFATSASLRGLAWGVDGTALVVGGAILAVHFIRRAQTLLAAGFLVFIAGGALVVSGSAMSLEASARSFAAGAALWAAALALISAPAVMPAAVRVLGFIAGLLFAVTALSTFAGRVLTPLSEPLPFFAYPFLVLTMCGWAWWCRRDPA